MTAKQTAKSKFETIGAEIGKLVDKKNKAYGSSFTEAGDILRVLYPIGIECHQYDDLLAIARIVDKLFRIANDKGAFEESPYADIAGYGILGAAAAKRKQ